MTTALTTADDVEIDVASGLGTITLASALPPYNGGGTTHHLTVMGNGVTVVGFSGTNVFDTTGAGVGGMSFDDITINGGDFGINANFAATITVTNSTISGTAEDGIDDGTGAITVTDSTITGAGNDAVDSGSGTINVTGSALTNPQNDGIDNGEAATMVVSDSTIAGAGNDAYDAGGSAHITVTNSTISNNAFAAIDSGNVSQYNLAYDTFTGSGAGFGQVTGGTDDVLTMFGTVLAAPGAGGTDCSLGAGSTITSQGYNNASDSSCALTQPTDKQNAPDPMLGALGANGGIGETMVPQTGSPLIDTIPAASCQTGLASGVTTDERGITRPQGPGCDIGAVEVAVGGPNLNGYRLVANEGGIFDFGLNFNGSLANNKLNAPIVGIANSPGFNGYLMAGGDGGVFALGGANFYGSLGGMTIPSPIAAIAAPPAENGYWLSAQNGKIYNFGAVPALSALSLPSGAHIVGMASTQDGGGAWLTDNFGDVYAEGDAHYVGGLGGVHTQRPGCGDRRRGERPGLCACGG